MDKTGQRVEGEVLKCEGDGRKNAIGKELGGRNVATFFRLSSMVA